MTKYVKFDDLHSILSSHETDERTNCRREIATALIHLDCAMFTSEEGYKFIEANSRQGNELTLGHLRSAIDDLKRAEELLVSRIMKA